MTFEAVESSSVFENIEASFVIEETQSSVVFELSGSGLSVDNNFEVSEEVTTIELSLNQFSFGISPTPATTTFETAETITEIVEIGVPGPPGIPEEEIMYAKRVDFADDGITIYKGHAEPGVAENASLWRIQKLTIAASDGDVATLWAGGSASFTNRWDQRTTLTYS